jgi:hypothetical protein
MKNATRYTTGIRFFFLLIVFEGLVTFLFALQNQSMERNAVFAGYSASRLMVIAFHSLLILAALGFLFYSLLAWKPLEAGIERLSMWFDAPRHLYWADVGLALVSLGGLTAAWLTWRADAREVLALVEGIGDVGLMLERTLPTIVWVTLVGLESLVALFFLKREVYDANRLGASVLSTFMVLAVSTLILVDLVVRVAGIKSYILDWFVGSVFRPHIVPGLLLLSLAFAAPWLARRYPRLVSAEHAKWIKNALILFVAFWLIYHLSAIVGKRMQSPVKAYFPELAESFLQGKTYLENPTITHDLTFDHGHWYVAFPPLGALVMLPQVALRGVSGVNSINVSIFYGVLGVVLVYLILAELAARGWTKLSTSDNVWLTFLFGMGVIYWIALSGQIWYVNQTLTVTFVALSIWLLLVTRSPWLSGAGLAAAMLARPTIGLTSFLLFGIHWQMQKDDGKEMDLRAALRWLIPFGVPLAVAVVGMLWYNHIRFGSLYDFGYFTMNVGETYQQYLDAHGEISLYYLPLNAYWMLLSLPQKNPAVPLACGYFAGADSGISLLFAFPAMIYAFRSLKRRIWIWGAWASVFGLLSFLMLYFSEGGTQFSYRYSLDFTVPLVMLIAVGAGRWVSLKLRVLILAGVLVNYWGMLWWIGHWCRF